MIINFQRPVNIAIKRSAPKLSKSHVLFAITQSIITPLKTPIILIIGYIQVKFNSIIAMIFEILHIQKWLLFWRAIWSIILISKPATPLNDAHQGGLSFYGTTETKV